MNLKNQLQKNLKIWTRNEMVEFQMQNINLPGNAIHIIMFIKCGILTLIILRLLLKMRRYKVDHVNSHLSHI